MNKRVICAIMLAWAAISFLPSCNLTESPAQVVSLQCESQVNPLGIDRENPLLQWKIADSRRGAKQTACQILVATSSDNIRKDIGDLWDTGKIESDQSVHVAYAGQPLQSGMTYYWKVRVWDQDGKVSVWSEPALWEMGLLSAADWLASWVARSMDEPSRSVYMRKEINLPGKTIQKARLYVTGLGNYVFYINGNRVGIDLLTPGWTDFPKRLEYQVYDVSLLMVDEIGRAHV